MLLRGYDDKSNESNDFLLLIQKKEFKDLIALELYEYYFWNERHEFDLQLLKEIVDSVCNYFNSPEVAMIYSDDFCVSEFSHKKYLRFRID